MTKAYLSVPVFQAITEPMESTTSKNKYVKIAMNLKGKCYLGIPIKD